LPTLSKGVKSQGRIKTQSEDFVVEEITKNGTVLEAGKAYSAAELGMENQEGNFSIFIMQKSGWNTLQALKELARKFRKGIKSVGFAGTKDRTSVSVQLCSIFGVLPEAFSNIHIKDMAINGVWRGSEKIKMGDLLGNRFEVKVRSVNGRTGIDNILGELDGLFPNYYGEQRFGIRGNNVDIGVSMLKGDFKGAVLNYLTNTASEKNEEAVQARERLSEELDFKKALQYFPQYLKYERQVIEHLSRFPDSYTNALRRLPRSLSLMFVHSVEAFMFNKELSERITEGSIIPREGDLVCRPNWYGFQDLSTVEKFSGSEEGKGMFIIGNILGYDTKQTNEFESCMLDELGITLDSFKVKGMKELNSKGSLRAIFAPYKNLSCSDAAPDGSIIFRFSLPPGSYATVLLEEFIQNIS
jgi:tRNA pseudouridine13 synthase